VKPEVRRVGADWMGRAFAVDRDLELPERPRFIPDLVVVPFADDGWLVVGAEHEQVLRGRSARSCLPRLVNACDGTRTIGEVAAALHLPPAPVRNMVSLLCSRGLLEDGARAMPVPAGVEETARFFGRYIDVSRVNAHRGQAVARLAAAAVAITGADPAAERMAELLRESGVGVVTRAAGPSAERAVADEAALHVVISTGRDRRTPPAGERAFLLRLGHDETHVGPLLIPAMTACPACFERVHPHPVGEPDATWARYWVGVAATVVPLLLARLVVSGRAGAFDAYRLDSAGELNRHGRLAVPLPGCPVCDPGGRPRAHTDPLHAPWIYQFATSVPSRELVSPKAHQMHYAIANLELARQEKKKLFGGDAIPLPATAEPLDAKPVNRSAPASERVTIEQLATLLSRTGGYVDGANGRRRLAPTGGNLGSVDLWIIARRVAGLGAGVYHYDSPRHCLECVDRRVPGAAAIAAATGRSAGGDCLIIGTGALARCAQKYGPFAYRLVYLDSGVALTYAHAVAAALGLPLREAGDLDDGAVAGLLRLPTRWEFPIPTFAVEVGAGIEPSSARPAAGGGAPGRGSPRPLTSADYSDAILTALLEAASGPPPAGAAISAAVAPGRPADAGPRKLGLLDAVLRSRRAVRAYGNGALDARVLTAVALDAHAVLAARVLAGAAPCFVRCVLAVARPAMALDPGLYDVTDAGLTWRSTFSVADMHAISNQASLGAAPAALIALADLPAALEARGARGYRESAQHAGAAIGRAWLAATSYGLVGTAAGGVIAGGLRTVAGIEPFEACPLLAFHFGLPAESAKPGAGARS
jgi:SagB-type dehydrogenase family enzyme